MQRNILKSDLLLLLTAAIWGFAFVAQRVGMEFIGPFAYNSLRFGLGALTLLPFVIFRIQKLSPENRGETEFNNILLKGGSIIGVILFFGASFQQYGIIFTTAGKAGFITGLYVVLVPLIGLFWFKKIGLNTWFGAVLAVIGLYLLSMKGPFSIEFGDALVLIGAFFWAGHVLTIGYYSKRIDPIILAFSQFLVCSALSFAVSCIFETTTLDSILKAWIPILYAGIFSAGVAFTLQVVAQRVSPPAHASIIMSLESVFAVLGGWLILHETLSQRGLAGCLLMLLAMFISQDFTVRKRPENP